VSNEDDQQPPAEQPPVLRSVPPDNRKKPRKAPDRLRLISHELYEQMADVYLRGARTANEVAVKCNVAHQTAQKAIKRGWPDKSPPWPPLSERAEMWDRMHREATGNPANKDREQAAASWVVMKRQYLDISLGVRSVIAKAVLSLLRSVEDAVATQTVQVRQVHYEEVLDAKGKVTRRIPRTLMVDVQAPPSIHKVTASLADVASALAKTGAGEIEALMAKPPKGGDPGKKWDLSDEQLVYMAKNEGRLPPGVTVEMLGEG